MEDSKPYEIELTEDLIDYARRSAIKEAKKHCPDFVDCEDVGQDAVLHLMSNPPKFDPTKGAKEKSLIYTVVQRYVLKFNARQCRHASRYKQVVKPEAGDDDDREEVLGEYSVKDEVKRHRDNLVTQDAKTDDILEFIDSEESRELCRTVIECDGNLSAAARRIGVSEGTVRYRLRLLAPKLLAAGFNPFSSQE